MVQKKLAQDFYGLVAASVSKSRYQDMYGTTFDRIYDNQFNFTLEGGYIPNNEPDQLIEDCAAELKRANIADKFWCLTPLPARHTKCEHCETNDRDYRKPDFLASLPLRQGASRQECDPALQAIEQRKRTRSVRNDDIDVGFPGKRQRYQHDQQVGIAHG